MMDTLLQSLQKQHETELARVQQQANDDLEVLRQARRD
jgi:hypothetical protein